MVAEKKLSYAEENCLRQLKVDLLLCETSQMGGIFLEGGGGGGILGTSGWY